MKINEKLKELITTYDGQDIDLCYYVFEALNEVDVRESSIGLKFFFEEIRTNVTDKSLKLETKVSQEELNQYHKMYGKYINELLNVLVKKAHLNAWATSDFYDTLWTTLKEDSLLENVKSYAFAILCFAQSPLLPYVELDKPVEMDNDKFSTLIRDQMQSVQKELFRNIAYYDLPYKTLTKSYINIQHYASIYFNNPAGKSIGLQNAIQILNLDQDKSYHNALNDAYYTAQVFIRIYNPSIVPDVYMYTTVKSSSSKRNNKKQINYDKLFAEFAKILQRDLTKEEKKIIDLAYKMGKTNQFLTESTIYKKR